MFSDSRVSPVCQLFRLRPRSARTPASLRAAFGDRHRVFHTSPPGFPEHQSSLSGDLFGVWFRPQGHARLWTAYLISVYPYGFHPRSIQSFTRGRGKYAQKSPSTLFCVVVAFSAGSGRDITWARRTANCSPTRNRYNAMEASKTPKPHKNPGVNTDEQVAQDRCIRGRRRNQHPTSARKVGPGRSIPAKASVMDPQGGTPLGNQIEAE